MGNKYKAALLITLAVVFGWAPPAGASVPAPSTADGFTQMFADKNDMTWSGSDGTISYQAPNGRVYWVNGDTFRSNGEDPDGSYPDNTTIVSNSILMQNGGQLVNAMANGGIGVPDPATHTAQNQERYWPAGTFYANNFLYVLCMRVITDPTAGFKVTGSEMAKYTIAANGKLTFKGMRAIPSTNMPMIAGPAGIQWTGDALVKDSYVYVYGQTLAPKTEPQYAIHYTYVARVPVALVESPSAWRFYKKSTGEWVNSVTKLSDDQWNIDALVASQVSSVRFINSKYVMIHKPWNNWGSTVYAEIGDNPWGPFTTRTLFESPAGTWEGKSYETYGPVLHPEQTLSGADSGKILVSINWNGPWADVLSNADLYKPRFYAIGL